MKKAIVFLALLFALGCATTGYYHYVERNGPSFENAVDSTVQCYDIDIARQIPINVLEGVKVKWTPGAILMAWDIPNRVGDKATIYLDSEADYHTNRELLKHFIGHLILMRTLGITTHEGRTQWMQRHSLCMTDRTDCRNDPRWLTPEDPARGCYE